MRYALLVAAAPWLVACGGPATPARTVPAPGPLVHEAHVPSVQAPLGPQIDMRVFVPPPPKPPLRIARIPGRRAPCFPHRDVLAAADIYRDLEDHALSIGVVESPPKLTYGTCTVENGEIRDALGILVAELHCGITVHVPGIIDHLGFEVGAAGTDVAREQPDGDALCWPDGDKHSRCWFEAPEGEQAHAHYSFPHALPSDPWQPVRGDEARALFQSYRVSHFTQRMWCH